MVKHILSNIWKLDKNNKRVLVEITYFDDVLDKVITKDYKVNENILTLKEKIEKDIDNLRRVYMPSSEEVVKEFISIHAMKEILNKRFRL